MIVYVEGIPASGKTTVLKRIANRYPEKVLYIPEYVNVEEGKQAEKTGDQTYFMKNDN
jgi:uridine kinase